MLKIKKKISNPMTVIAIFAVISETSAAVSLPFLENKEREIYVWFLISFPFYLLFLFFITLNFNYRSLYSPSDFEKDKNFLKARERQERDNKRSGPSNTRMGHETYTATDPPDRLAAAINLIVQHHIHLPESMHNLQIIDIRQLDFKFDLASILEKIRHPTRRNSRLVVIISNDMSDNLLKENLIRHAKDAKKSNNTTHCIIYNTRSYGVTIVGQI
ncbi:hypothetical protein [Pseudomonas koreensis]|uniref:Uncharacterized protein n=1 Tax=Pseudomonas koreensis TaxID=198620 RepID=A0A9X2XGG5_9PSED|nr:hypothetical protein [Pseudomonas koreensis]MCU7248512.1 hypothetical protein [Pseudomonas koreensis]